MGKAIRKGFLALPLAFLLVVAPFPSLASGGQTGIVEASGPMTRIVSYLVAKYGITFEKFIRSHVARLAQQGEKALGSAVRTKLRTVADHERRLVVYRGQARAKTDQARIRSFEKEIQRLRTELEILRDTMRMLGIKDW